MATEGRSLDFNLTMLNLWIGLCKGVHGLPSSIRKLDYREHSIEYRFRNQDGEVCNPELIVFSRPLGHSLLLEWKSGANTEADQLRRYSRVTSKNLAELAFIPKAATTSFDVAIVGRAEHTDRLRMGIDKSGHPFPLLAADDAGIRLAHNRFSCHKLNDVFLPGLALDLRGAPMSFVPISDTSAPWEVAEVVLPRILERMLQRDALVKSSTLCTSICPIWDVLHRDVQNAIKRRVCEVLQQAAMAEFQPFLTWRKTQNDDCAVDFSGNPVSLHGSRRDGALRRLRNAQRDLIDRLQQGKTFIVEKSLFDDFTD